MSKPKWAIDRRKFLKGTLNGIAGFVALPMLEVMFPGRRQASAMDSAPPLRFLGYHTPNGLVLDKWVPPGSNLNTLSPSLAPFSGNKSFLKIVSGLGRFTFPPDPGPDREPHAQGPAGLLTGTAPRFSPRRAGISVDQRVDQLYRASGYNGVRAAFLSPDDRNNPRNLLSWRSENVVTPVNSDPRALFNLLFPHCNSAPPPPPPSDGGPSDAKLKAIDQLSVLDIVLGDINRLKRNLGNEDKIKLDQYLSGLREVEAKVSEVANQPNDVPPHPTPEEDPFCQREPNFSGEAKLQKLALFFEVLALGFESDRIRSAVVSVGGGNDNSNYENLIPASTSTDSMVRNLAKQSHHALSHMSVPGFPASIAYPKIISILNEIAVAQYTLLNDFANKLKGVSEGSNHLLHNSCILFGSGYTIRRGEPFGDELYDSHARFDISMGLLGKAGGQIRTNHHLDFNPARAQRLGIGREYGDLLISVLKLFGAPESRFGDSGDRPFSLG